MLGADDLGREDRGGRGQRIDRRVDAERGHLAAQLGGGVEVGEGRERRRVGVVVGRHVDRLQRGDRTALGGRDALLQLAHLVGERRLVAHRGRHAAEQRRHLRAGLDEAEDVVDEEQHVLVLHVAEVLGHREGGQGDAQAHARRLVHLAEHEGRLLVDARLLHLEPQVGALTGALADTGEHRHAAVVLRHATDHLGDEHRLAHPGAAEQPDLAALQVGREQVDDLDAGLEHLGDRLERVEGGGVAVDVPALEIVGVAGLGVEGFAPGVPHVTEHLRTDRDADAAAGVAHRGAAAQAVGGLQAHGTHATVAELLGDLGEHGDVAAADDVDRHLDRGVYLG